MLYSLRFFLVYFIVRFLYLRKVEIKVIGLENVPKNEGFIVASNHDHSYDPHLIFVSLKKFMHFLAVDRGYKRSLFRKKWLSKLERFIFKDSILGLLLRLLQQIQVSYSDNFINKRAVLTASKFLRKKRVIGIFPEGVIERKQKNKKIFPGVAILAKKNNAKILPVYVWTNAPCDSWSKVNFTKASVIIGEPLKFYRSTYYTKKAVVKKIYGLEKFISKK